MTSGRGLDQAERRSLNLATPARTLPAMSFAEHNANPGWLNAGPDGESAMQDLLMLLFTVIFFVLAFLYVRACQKLR
jgi:hypothetical protein